MLWNMTQPEPSEVCHHGGIYVTPQVGRSLLYGELTLVLTFLEVFPRTWASRPCLGPCPYLSFLVLLELGTCQPSRASFLQISTQFMIGWIHLNFLTWIFKSFLIVEIFSERDTIASSLVGGKYRTRHYSWKHIINPRIKDIWDISFVSCIDSYISETLNLIQIDMTWSALQCLRSQGWIFMVTNHITSLNWGYAH